MASAMVNLDTLTLPQGTRVTRHYGEGRGLRVAFPNGRGASVIVKPFSKTPLLEVAVLNSFGELDYGTPITDDVVTVASANELSDILDRIANLMPEIV